MVIAIMKGYIIFVIILMLLYTARHFYFTLVRFLGKQRLYYNDILTSRLKTVSVLIPMHNEEQVLSNVLNALLECDYDRDRLEIIPINDNSTDKTKEMLEEYLKKTEPEYYPPVENLLDLIYEHYTENNPVEKNTIAGKAAKVKERELEEWLRGLDGMDRLVDDEVAFFDSIYSTPPLY